MALPKSGETNGENFANMMRGLIAGPPLPPSGQDEFFDRFASAHENIAHNRDEFRRATGHNIAMNSPTREEIEARLSATEARVDARLAGFEKTMAESLAAMRSDIAAMRSDVTTQLSGVREGVAELRGEVGGIKTVTNWTLGMIGVAIAAAALWVGFRQADKPPPAPTQQPIIIQVPQPAAPPSPPPPATKP